MASILSVTRYPPTTLIVARTSAANPRIVANMLLSVPPVAIIAPTIVMPLMAFDPLINGVWSWLGTLDMSSNPRNTDSVNMNNRRMSSMAKDSLHKAFVGYFAVVGYDARFHYRVLHIYGEVPVYCKMLDEVVYV